MEIATPGKTVCILKRGPDGLPQADVIAILYVPMYIFKW